MRTSPHHADEVCKWLAGPQISYVFAKKDPYKEGDEVPFADVHQRLLTKLTQFHRVVRHTSQVRQP